MNSRLVWFRSDLRLHDNETLTAALDGAAGSVAYVYIYHPELSGNEGRECPRPGRNRTKYLAESLQSLRTQLRERRADLICLEGDPVELLPSLCRRLKIQDVFYSRLTAFNEMKTENVLAEKLKSLGVRSHPFQTHPLLHEADFDFDLSQPMSFSQRRKKVEKAWRVRPPLPVPEVFPPALTTDDQPWNFEAFIVPEIEERGFKTRGGEAAALERLQDYFWRGNFLKKYKETRNGLLNVDDSSKFSPALSLGCVSARFIYQELQRYEKERVKNSSTGWFLSELLWRDHFHFLAKGRGVRLFTERLSEKTDGFSNWCEGRTGVPFVDAAMTELKRTGWLSNRMRQNAASFLIHNLDVDWRLGAEWFESQLMDYDPCSNWGNWAYIAGADFAGQPHRFDLDQQARMYDPESAYIQYWL